MNGCAGEEGTAGCAGEKGTVCAVLAGRAMARRRTSVVALVRAADVPFLAFVLSLGIVVTAVTSNGLGGAARRLGRPCEQAERRGIQEREVVTAAAGAALLIMARDGDQSRLGPRSLGKAARFVVDHAPCPVLLVWPEPAPAITTMPPPPPEPRPPKPQRRP